MTRVVGGVWVWLTWDQAKLIEILSEGHPDGVAQELLKSAKNRMNEKFSNKEIVRNPNYHKARPWFLVSFEDDGPISTFRFIVPRSVSDLENPKSKNSITHSAERHLTHKCCITKDASISFIDDETHRVMVQLSVFHQKSPKKNSCHLEPLDSAKEIYKMMSKTFPGRAKYARKK